MADSPSVKRYLICAPPEVVFKHIILNLVPRLQLPAGFIIDIQPPGPLGLGSSWTLRQAHPTGMVMDEAKIILLDAGDKVVISSTHRFGSYEQTWRVAPHPSGTMVMKQTKTIRQSWKYPIVKLLAGNSTRQFVDQQTERIKDGAENEYKQSLQQ